MFLEVLALRFLMVFSCFVRYFPCQFSVHFWIDFRRHFVCFWVHLLTQHNMLANIIIPFVLQVIVDQKKYLDPLRPCCKDCGLSLEAKALEGESADALLLKTKSDDRKLRGEIIAGKNISAGTVAPAFPTGDRVSVRGCLALAGAGV